MLVTPSPPTINATSSSGPSAPAVEPTTTSTVRLLAPVVALSGATYITRHPTLPVFYVTQELGRNGRIVTAIHRDPKGRWKAIGQATVGDAPVHVIVDKTGKYAYIASYTGGSVTQIALTESGGFGHIITVAMPTGSGSDPTRQSGPHPHSTAITPDGRYVVVADLGTDSLHVFEAATMHLLSTERLPAESGPRTAVFLSATTLVVSEELGDAVSVWSFDPSRGLTLRSRLALEPGSTPSDVVVRTNAPAPAPALLVLERGPNQITEIVNGMVGRHWPTPDCGARSAFWLADGTLAVACTKGGEVRVLRFTSTGATVTAVAAIPRAAAIQTVF